MAFNDPPYATAKTDHSARLFRRQFQQSLGEGSGVSRPGDLKVQALPVPGAGFRVAPGGGVAQSRDTATSARESYGPVNEEEIVFSDVPGTGSGQTRRDLVIVEITDPQMQSVSYPEPTDPDFTGAWLDGGSFCRITVIQGVAASVTSLDQIATGPFANVTGITLAAINYLAATSTIQQAMIEDLRKVHSPRSLRVLRAVNLSDVQRLASTSAPPTGGATFPTEFTGDAGKIRIPSWATRVRVVMTWGSVKFPAGSTAAGSMWVQVGQNVDPDVFRTQVGSFDANPASRDTWIVADTRFIPAAMRGQDKWFFPRASLSASQTTANQPYVTASSSIVLDVEFFEDIV